MADQGRRRVVIVGGGFRNRLGATASWWFAFTRDLRQERTFTSGQVGQVADVYTAHAPAPDPQRKPA